MAETTVPSNSPSKQPTRRRLLGRAATFGVAAAMPTAALAAEPVDPHLEWWRRREEIRDWINGVGSELSDEETDAPFDEGCRLEDLLGKTPATTLAGVRAQVAMVHHSLSEVGSHNDTDIAALENALATLERLAEGA